MVCAKFQLLAPPLWGLVLHTSGHLTICCLHPYSTKCWPQLAITATHQGGPRTSYLQTQFSISLAWFVPSFSFWLHPCGVWCCAYIWAPHNLLFASILHEMLAPASNHNNPPGRVQDFISTDSGLHIPGMVCAKFQLLAPPLWGLVLHTSGHLTICCLHPYSTKLFHGVGEFPVFQTNIPLGALE